MEYIVVTLLAVSLTAFIVYRIANRFFGLNLRIKPIVLCAACAIMISIILPRVIVSFAGLLGTVGVMAVFAIIFAYFIAYYDDLATEKAEKESEKRSPAAKQDNRQAEKSVAELALSSEHNQIHCFALPDLAQNVEEDKRVSPVCRATGEVKKGEKDGTQDILNPAEQQGLNGFEQVDKTVNSIILSKIKANQEGGGEATVRGLPACTATGESAQVVAVAAGIEPCLQQIDEYVGDKAMEENMSVNLSLDDLIDLGFKYKEQHDFDKALDVFRQALQICSNSDAAPYLAIEIGTLLKNKGAYDAAVEAFVEGRNLARMQGNDLIEQEIIGIIAYLRIIKNVLLENAAGLVPFDSIPSHLMNTIDREFADWRKLEQN